MRKLRPWAQVLIGATAAWLLCFSGLSVAETAGAQTETSHLEQFGNFPYQGDDETACKLLMNKTSITQSECKVGIIKQRASKCGQPYYIQDNEVITTTFTVNGVHKAVTVVVALKYPKGHELEGEPLPANHPARKSDSCPIGNEDGLAVLMPNGCPNWSVHNPVFVLPDEPTGAGHTTSNEPDCRFVMPAKPISAESHQFWPGLELEGCISQFLPGSEWHLENTLQMPQKPRIYCE